MNETIIVNNRLQVLTTGPRPNTGFVSTLGSDTLSDRGFVKVRPTLQLLHHSNIYAAGDVIDWDEQKQAAKAAGQVGVVVANILSALAGQKPTAQYKGSLEMIAITNGKVCLRVLFGSDLQARCQIQFSHAIPFFFLTGWWRGVSRHTLGHRAWSLVCEDG